MILLALLAAAAAIAIAIHPGSNTDTHARIDRTVNTLLAGIPQQDVFLGDPDAPFTMEVFLDLEDPTGRWWFRENLPAIINQYVRSGTLRLQYHAFKRNTYWPTVFVNQQTAALAAGNQNKLWNYTLTFFYEQRKELTRYVTENYLDGVARQIPGLNITQWHTDRHTGRREEQTTSEDQQARTIELHVTPAFRIGKTNGPMNILTGQHMVQYPEQHHPIALIQASDLPSAINALRHNHRPPREHPHIQIQDTRLE